jgi:hypothetical protein
MRNRDGVEYNTEIVLIVKRIHSTTLSQPNVLKQKGILESRINHQLRLRLPRS